jgi:vacuolar protein sorting-associated protein VTA1
MSLSIPAELKKITPYIRRAEELDKDKAKPESRLVAYYCRQFAVHTGIPFATSSVGCKTCLGDILNELEKEKAAMGTFTRDESKFLCRAFVDKIFDKADAEDRAGLATKTTAKTFYAAATFFEILQQFYDEADESEEREEERKRTVYCKWKATDILKAIKEGRQPAPGGYGEQAEEEERSEPLEREPMETDDSGFPSIPVAPMPVPAIAPPPPMVEVEEEEHDTGIEMELGLPPPYSPGPTAPPAHHQVFVPKPPMPDVAPRPPIKTVAPVPVAASPTKKKAGFMSTFKKQKPPTPSGKATKEQLDDAKELTKFAMAALENKDGDLAAQRLQQALEALGR